MISKHAQKRLRERYDANNDIFDDIQTNIIASNIVIFVDLDKALYKIVIKEKYYYLICNCFTKTVITALTEDNYKKIVTRHSESKKLESSNFKRYKTTSKKCKRKCKNDYVDKYNSLRKWESV